MNPFELTDNFLHRSVRMFRLHNCITMFSLIIRNLFHVERGEHEIRNGESRSITAIIALLCLCANMLHAADWPQFLGPIRNGISTETGLLEKWPPSGPPILWDKHIGAGYSAPSTRSGLLVLFHRIDNNEIVEAFQATNGQPVWRYTYLSQFVDPYGYNNGPRCTPLLTDDYCYTFGAEGMLTCLELKTGKLVWQRDTGKEWQVPEAFFGVGSTPILEDNLLFVMVGGQPNA